MKTTASETQGFPVRATFSITTQLAVLGAFLAAALVTRLPTFFLNEIGPDESLYFLMAQQWRLGHLPYTTIWDNKPIGIYVIFSLFQDLFGNDIAAIRVACILFVTATAFAVFRIVLLIPSPDNSLRRTAALIAGFTYILCSLSNDGLESNTEIFMVGFTAFAVLCAASSGALKNPYPCAFLGGLLFGCAFITKYVAIFEAPAIAFLFLYLQPPASFRSAFFISLCAVAGAVLPVLLPIWLYAHYGQFNLWYDHSILANLRRESTRFQIGYLFVQRIGEWLPLWLCAALLITSMAWRRPRIFSVRPEDFAARLHLCLVIWLIFAFLGVTSAKGFYSHFYIQALPVLSVIVGWVVLGFLPGIRFWSFGKAAAVAFLFMAIPLFAAAATLMKAAKPVLTVNGHHVILHKDTGLLIAQYVQAAPTLRPVKFYDFDYDIIIYSLTKTNPPTQYVFPMFLTTCFLSFVSGVDAQQEETRVLSLHPQFILRSVPPSPILPSPREDNVYAELQSMLAAQYEVAKTYDGAVLYELRPDMVAAQIPPKQYPSSCP
jgi:4-amino-4-deoxy-L-arabinose transferase-like glycosyltransferase